MLSVYYCEYFVNNVYHCQYVIASNKLNAVELLCRHYYTLSPRYKVTSIKVHDLEFISIETVKNLKSKIKSYG